MTEHKETIQAAKQTGYDDAQRGEYDTYQLPCRCDKCLKAYDAGQEAAMRHKTVEVE